MVKSIAEKHGLRATFMPKPFSNLTGNGCHAHISVWDLSGKKNIFEDKKADLGLSGKESFPWRTDDKCKIISCHY